MPRTLSLEGEVIPLLRRVQLLQLHGKVTVAFHGTAPPRITINAEIHNTRDLAAWYPDKAPLPPRASA